METPDEIKRGYEVLLMEKLFAVLLGLAIVLAFAVSGFAEQFDRPAVVPELVRASNLAQAQITGYQSENKKAEAAARIVATEASGFPEGQRREAKARALCQWQNSLNAMARDLQAVHTAMAAIRNSIENDSLVNLGEAGGRIEGVSARLEAELSEQSKTFDAMMKVYEISPEAAGEAGAQKINALLDAIERRKALRKKTAARGEWLAGVKETMRMKLERLDAVSDAVAARIEEVKMEAEVVGIIKQLDMYSIVEDGLGIKDNPENLFKSSTSDSLDKLMKPRESGRLSERERLKLRLGEGGYDR